MASCGRSISEAGLGWGKQVFPGTILAVDYLFRLADNVSTVLRIRIPVALKVAVQFFAVQLISCSVFFWWVD